MCEEYMSLALVTEKHLCCMHIDSKHEATILIGIDSKHEATSLIGMMGLGHWILISASEGMRQCGWGNI